MYDSVMKAVISSYQFMYVHVQYIQPLTLLQTARYTLRQLIKGSWKMYERKGEWISV